MRSAACPTPLVVGGSPCPRSSTGAGHFCQQWVLFFRKSPQKTHTGAQEQGTPCSPNPCAVGVCFARFSGCRGLPVWVGGRIWQRGARGRLHKSEDDSVTSLPLPERLAGGQRCQPRVRLRIALNFGVIRDKQRCRLVRGRATPGPCLPSPKLIFDSLMAWRQRAGVSFGLRVTERGSLEAPASECVGVSVCLSGTVCQSWGGSWEHPGGLLLPPPRLVSSPLGARHAAPPSLWCTPRCVTQL